MKCLICRLMVATSLTTVALRGRTRRSTWRIGTPATLKKLLLRVSALTLATTLSLSAQAADAVTEAMQVAYAPYRAALFRTNGKSQAEAQQAMVQTQQAWKGVAERFAASPPAPYDRDADFVGTLNKVAAVYDKAAGEIGLGKLHEAHETLEAARDHLATLRRRNGVVVYSDHMNAFHAEMERLLIERPQYLAGPHGLQLLIAHSGVLEYLARQLRLQAPAMLLQNAEFETLLKGVEASVQNLKSAAFGQDPATIQDAMSKVKMPYSKLFLQFG